jgi:predicted Zn-dependent peptidase
MNYELHKLENGVRVITVPLLGLESATVTVWVGTGSRYETHRVSGISHFLEHMVFKGGKKRVSAKAISEAVDAIGGEFNAGTTKEWTNFYIKARAGSIDTAFDVLADMVLTPALRQEDIDREKGVIVEEIGMYEDTPLWKIEDVFENLIYKGHGLGRDIIGTKETVTSLKRIDFVRYRNAHYYPKNIVVAVAGGVTGKKALALAKKYFGGLTKTPKIQNSKNLRYKTKQTKPQVLLSSKRKDQAHFVLGFRASALGSKDRYAETVLAAILGGGMSSRLFTEIREKRGLAYAVKAARNSYADCGCIGVYAGVDPKKAVDAVSVALDQCYGLANGKYPVASGELAKAKEYIKGHLALSLEDTKAVNAFYGLKELILGKLETPEQVFETIDKVAVDDIVKAAKKIFRPEGINLAVIGPYKEADKFKKVVLQ